MQGPEIRTGFLVDEKPIKLVAGKEITITTDYETKGNDGLIAMRHVHLCFPASLLPYQHWNNHMLDMLYSLCD